MANGWEVIGKVSVVYHIVIFVIVFYKLSNDSHFYDSQEKTKGFGFDRYAYDLTFEERNELIHKTRQRAKEESRLRAEQRKAELEVIKTEIQEEETKIDLGDVVVMNIQERSYTRNGKQKQI